MKIALASSDGKFVSRHFGNTPLFYIAEVDSKGWSITEKRENTPACAGNDAGCGEASTVGNKHNHERFTESVKIISDCGAVICARIGNFAQNGLNAIGIQALEKPGFIEDLLDSYVKYMARTAKKPHLAASDSEHPCFNSGAKTQHGRIHLPVSAKCNIKCRFCERKINADELCPGVTSKILQPQQAAETITKALELCPEIKVIGVAGPGDPLADDAAIETFKLIGNKFPGLSKCISTNGLALPEKIYELAETGVKHITVTVNAVDPAITEKIVSHIEYKGEVINDIKAAEILLSCQLEGIRRAAENDMEIKINTVLIPGVNDKHIEEISKTVAALGIKYQNILPLIPRGELANIKAPDCAMLDTAREKAALHATVFRHCAHCRADAIGIPGTNDFSKELYADTSSDFKCRNNCR